MAIIFCVFWSLVCVCNWNGLGTECIWQCAIFSMCAWKLIYKKVQIPIETCWILEFFSQLTQIFAWKFSIFIRNVPTYRRENITDISPKDQHNLNAPCSKKHVNNKLTRICNCFCFFSRCRNLERPKSQRLTSLKPLKQNRPPRAKLRRQPNQLKQNQNQLLPPM